MPDAQEQFDGQSPVPGYTLFQGKDGQNFYLKGEGLADDEIRGRVTTLRQKTQQPATAAAPAKPTTAAEIENAPKDNVLGTGMLSKVIRGSALGAAEGAGLPNSDAPVSGFFSNLMRFAKNVSAFANPTMDNLSEKMQAAQELYFGPRREAVDTANRQMERPGILSKLGAGISRGMAEVPLVGPPLVRSNEEFVEGGGEHDPEKMAHGLASGVTQAAMLGAGGSPEARAAVDATIETTAKPIVKIGQGIREGMGLNVPQAEKAFTQAIQPGVNIPRAQESVQIAGPRMQQVRESLPDGTPGKEIRSSDGAPATGQALELNRAAKKQVLQAIDDRIGPVKDLQPDTSPVAEAMEQSISKRTATQFPDTAARIQTRAATYRDSGLTLGDVEDSIQDANKSLRNFYKQPTAGESPTSADMDATLAEVGSLRKLLDEKVGELGGNGTGDLQDLKREYGALRDVEKALARQHAIATRVKGGGLWEGLAYLHAAGDLVSGNLLGAARAGATIGIGKLLKNLRDPNYLLEQSFHGPKAFEAAEPIGASAGPPQPKALLPAPATPMGGPGPEDTSGAVRGGRWTTPKAALPAPGEEAPIEAKFLRNISRAANTQPQGLKGLLGSGETKLPATDVPPLVDPKFMREAIGSVTDPNRLGIRGEGGVRTTPKGELPAMTGLHERARLLIQQTMDMMRSGDRPGRYFDESEAGDVRTGSRQIRGGDWRGVKSMRSMLPWANENEFSPTEMEQALRLAERGRHNKVFNDALNYVKREAAKAGREPGDREPGEDETPF